VINSVGNEVKQIIRNRAILLAISLVLGLGHSSHRGADFADSMVSGVAFAVWLVSGYSLLAGGVMLFRVLFFWKKYCWPNHVDVVIDTWFITGPFTAFTNKILNERGRKLRNRMLANIAIFCLGWLILAIPAVVVSSLLGPRYFVWVG